MVMENRYDKYKDSGIAWIGEIPEHWNIGYVGKYLNEVSNRNTSQKETNTLQFKMGEIISKSDGNSKYNPESIESYNIVYPDTIMINGLNLSFDFISQRVALVREQGAITSAYLAMKPNDNCSPNYITYLFKSYDYKKVFHALGKGLRATLNYNIIRNELIVLPSLSEQQSIATYLDQKCGEIDELITLQEEMITKLQSYKQSVITEAVTKGLDKNVPLKDSGIEWIGEIPEHWEASKTLFNLSMPITDGPHTTPELFEIGIPFVSAEAVSFGNGRIDFSRIRGYISENFYQECCKKYVPQVDDIYMIKSGATTGRVAIVDTDIKFTIWSPLAVFRCNKERMLPRFLLYQLQSNGYQKQIELNWSYGTQQNIGMRTLEKLILSVPPLSEQQSIADYLDQKCSEIDELISIKQQKIEKLKDYKKSLIFECVTGKRKVS